MRFPVTILDVEDYLNKLNVFLKDNHCAIFFDTNLFSQLFKIYPEARSEFYAWVDPMITAKRVAITSWSMNEYIRRFIDNKLGDYTNEISHLKTVTKMLDNVKSFLTMFIDDKQLIGTTFSDRNSYLKEFGEGIEKIREVANATKEGKDYINALNLELQHRFEPVIMSSDIYSLIQDINQEAIIRCENSIPPAYMDADKKINKYGDLVIWKEILAYCKNKKVKRAILITNDGKKDWVYKPQKYRRDGRELPNEAYQLADPRLVHEFKIHTGTEDFCIIKFEMLVQLLWTEQHEAFSKLSEAIQISTIEKDAKRKKSEGEEPTAISTIIPEAVPEPIDVHVAVPEPDLHPIDAPERLYIESALADREYDSTGHPLSAVLEKLKSYNWDEQNKGIALLKPLVINSLEENDVSKNFLFVLGRNIYQAACGNAFSAIQYINDLHKNLSLLHPFKREHLLNGIFYEIYFNGDGNFRDGKYKIALLEDVFATQSDAYTASINFIRGQLEPYRDRLLLLPNVRPERVEIRVTFILAANQGHFLVPVYQIQTMEVNGRSLLIDDPVEDDFPPETTYFTFGKLKARIFELFAAPKSQIELIITPQIEEERYVFVIPTGRKIGL